MKKRKILMSMVAVLGLTLLFATSALAVPAFFIDFASDSPDGLISFGSGGVNTFQFVHTAADFDVTHSGPFDTMHGFLGFIGGTYSIGTVGGGGAGELASVSLLSAPGTNVFTISDGLTPFTSLVNWLTITTTSNGVFGGLNYDATFNLNNFHYTGADPELQLLDSLGEATVTVSWQFGSPGNDLNFLKTVGPTNPVVTSYSGSIVPVPPTAILLGSGLLGLVGLRYRSRKKS